MKRAGSEGSSCVRKEMKLPSIMPQLDIHNLSRWMFGGCTIEVVAKGQGPTGLHRHHMRIIVRVKFRIS